MDLCGVAGLGEKGVKGKRQSICCGVMAWYLSLPLMFWWDGECKCGGCLLKASFVRQ